MSSTRSSSSARSGSAATLTPSVYAHIHTPNPWIPYCNSNINNTIILPLPFPRVFSSTFTATTLERGPKFFFTSEKTGEGVADVSKYVTRRLNRRWKYEEQM